VSSKDCYPIHGVLKRSSKDLIPCNVALFSKHSGCSQLNKICLFWLKKRKIPEPNSTKTISRPKAAILVDNCFFF
jgi:hypothetical protein